MFARAVPGVSIALAMLALPGGASGGLLDGEDEPPWPVGWHVQDYLEVKANRAGDEILLANPVGSLNPEGLTPGLTEQNAPCDPFSPWNGVDGRWYVRPVAWDGSAFNHLHVRAEALQEANVYLLVAHYREVAGACVPIGWDVGRGLVVTRFPSGTTHFLVMSVVPQLAGDAASEAPVRAGHTQLDVSACLHVNCFVGGGQGEWTGAFRHPSPNPLGVPSVPPLT